MFAKLTGSQQTLVALTIVLAGLMVGRLVLVPAVVMAQQTVTGGDEDSLQRSRDAAAARYAAVARAHTASPDAIERGRDAASARYTAMAQSRNAQQRAQGRGLDATAARYTAIAQAHAARPSGIVRGRNASSARHAGMAQSYGTMEVAGTR